MGLAWRYLEALCRVPHRGSATEAERRAAGLLAQWLGELGYQVDMQEFRAPRDTLYLGPAVVLCGAAAAALIPHGMPWAALFASLLLLVPLVGEMLGSSRIDFDLLLPTYRSQNVIARRKQGAGRGGCTLVISAHYDTQRGSYLFHPKMAPWLQWYFYIVYAGLLAALAGVAGTWAFGGQPWAVLLSSAGGWLCAANAAFLLLCRLTGRHVNGANDNGSGVALLLALAERIAAHPLRGLDVVFLLTGSEEVGTRGMRRFVHTCGLDRARTRFVNLDNLGAGTLHYLTGEGMLKVTPYSQELVELARATAAETDRPVRPRGNLLLPTDGLPPALAGYEAISFLAFDERGQLPHYHWHTDTLERVDPVFLRFAEEFLWKYVTCLAGMNAMQND